MLAIHYIGTLQRLGSDSSIQLLLDEIDTWAIGGVPLVAREREGNGKRVARRKQTIENRYGVTKYGENADSRGALGVQSDLSQEAGYFNVIPF